MCGMHILDILNFTRSVFVLQLCIPWTRTREYMFNFSLTVSYHWPCDYWPWTPSMANDRYTNVCSEAPFFTRLNTAMIRAKELSYNNKEKNRSSFAKQCLTISPFKQKKQSFTWEKCLFNSQNGPVHPSCIQFYSLLHIHLTLVLLILVLNPLWRNTIAPFLSNILQITA